MSYSYSFFLFIFIFIFPFHDSIETSNLSLFQHFYPSMLGRTNLASNPYEDDIGMEGEMCGTDGGWW